MAIQLWALAGGVIPQMTTRSMQTLLVATFAIILVNKASARESNQPAVQMQILLTASSSWDGEPYDAYPWPARDIHIKDHDPTQDETRVAQPSDAKCRLYRYRRVNHRKKERWKEATFHSRAGPSRNGRHTPPRNFGKRTGCTHRLLRGKPWRAAYSAVDSHEE